MRVVRVYHAGRDASHRERDRALVRGGAELTLIVPLAWPGPSELTAETFDIVELPVRRAGDVNRHRFARPDGVAAVLERVRPHVLDLHEEPFSAVTRQVLGLTGPALTVVGYTAQNIDKRFPPPFGRWERHALGRWDGVYPCSRQAASVVVGKGFRGVATPLPLPASAGFTAGMQTPPGDTVRMLLVGRLVPEKGVLDAVRVLAAVRAHGPASLLLVGHGPEAEPARRLAGELGVGAELEVEPWLDPAELALRYRQAHLLLAPSRATDTWVEQFGRMVVEAHASGAVVVGYDSGSLPEVIGPAGVVVSEGDVGAMAGAVIALRRDPQRWQALRATGLEARERLTWDSVAALQLELYRAAAARSRRTAARPPVHAQRRQAVREWGAPASGGARPFALPILRSDSAVTRALARAVDVMRREPADAGSSDAARLKVVYVDHVARLSGGEIALERLIAAVPDVDAHVILAEDGPLRARLEAVGASVEILALAARTRDASRTRAGAGTAIGLVRYTVRLARRLRQLRPDLVHTNSLKAGYYGSAAARLARVPVLWHVRDRIAADYLPPRAVRLTRLALRVLPDAVVCNSTETRSTVRTVAATVHDPYAATRAAQVRRHPGVVIGMLGRIAPWKGQEVFVRAFAAAFAGRTDVTARIIGSAMFGENDHLARLTALVDELGVGGQVAFVGFVDDVEGALAGLDVVVHASTVPEPFGQVVVEGMAAGLAVVAADAGGPREIITDGIDGLLTPPGDVAALGSALTALIEQPELRARLSSAARARSLAFRPALVGPEMREVYLDLLSARGAARR